MMCAWESLLGILPGWLREKADKEGRENLVEIRLRMNAPPELIFTEGIVRGDRNVAREDLSFCINSASQYSPWSAATISQGYITARGGHRIGLCGDAVCRDGMVSGIREIDSVCIRIARDFPDIAKKINYGQNILIIGAPGWGKTTVLRDLIRQKAEKRTVAVADERGELFPPGFVRGIRMDVLTGAPKSQAIDRLLRTMCPEYIAMDEITAEEDTNALYHAACCGVNLLATAHASGVEDYLARAVYKPLHKLRLFDTLVVMRPDRTFRIERMDK